MPLHSTLKPICDSSLQLGISVVLKLSSIALVELLGHHRQSKYFNLSSAENLTHWSHPLIYYGIQGRYKSDLLREFPIIVSSFTQFDVELIPHYTILSPTSRRLYIGFEFQHDALKQIKLAFSKWGGEGFPHNDFLRSSSKSGLGPHIFFPIKVMKTENEIQAQDITREFSIVLTKFGNIFTADSLLLQEYSTNSDGTPKQFLTLASHPLNSSKYWKLQGLSKLRMLSLKEELMSSTIQRSTSISTSETLSHQVKIRKIMGTPKDNHLEWMRQQYVETEFHPGLLRKVKSKKISPKSSFYYSNDISMPTLGNQIIKFKDKRFVQGVPTNLKNFGLEKECIANPLSLEKITFKENKPNPNISNSLFSNNTSNSISSCSRQEARRLETERLNRPLIRYEKSSLIIRYNYFTYDIPLAKYKCYIRHINGDIALEKGS
ncbi:hypothetical protein HI914_04162 [Erysiphe necator]|nr:hypothetical protein HI914_04162 [Erysiphe necator]